MSEIVGTSEDRIFQDDALESESNEYLTQMSERDLERLIEEISDNIASNASFASELQYW